MNPYAAYQTQAAQTASPAQLVVMLYNGALAEVSRATRGLEASPVDIEDVNDCLGRAQAIVTHLAVTLDMERGGAVAANLASLYDFCRDRLVAANVAKSADGLEAVTSVLTDLRDAWEQGCVNGQAAAAVAG
ncbi:flagellar export chaperone FliS [Egicoccus sp. AB-alg2]|uniref:flagellar export chaperone FliS n=1 Tax=Egicoccus sp. AB-alg2 TaxID=3242693 RepID=UPI00359E43F9